MAIDRDDELLWNQVSRLRASPRKRKTLERLSGDPACASELASEFNMSRGSVSNVFRELKKGEPALITCLTPDMPHHRIYAVTQFGEEVLKVV